MREPEDRISEADDASRRLTRRADRTITIIQIAEAVIISIALVALAILFPAFISLNTKEHVQGRQIAADQKKIAADQKQIAVNQRRVQTACSFWRDLATLPVTSQSSELGTGIVVHSREAYEGFVCPEPLPAPSAILIGQARKYGIPVTIRP
jgi:hypothetical protein